jgi:hypothetical protein
MRALVDTTDLFFPHPNFGDAINRNVVQSEIEGGVHLNDVPPETVLEVQTKNHVYTIVHKAWDQALISRQPEFSQMLPDDDSRAADAWETVVAPIQ